MPNDGWQSPFRSPLMLVHFMIESEQQHISVLHLLKQRLRKMPGDFIKSYGRKSESCNLSHPEVQAQHLRPLLCLLAPRIESSPNVTKIMPCVETEDVIEPEEYCLSLYLIHNCSTETLYKCGPGVSERKVRVLYSKNPRDSVSNHTWLCHLEIVIERL